MKDAQRHLPAGSAVPRPMLRAKPCELKSKLTAKGNGRETSKMRERLPASAATLTEPPRRRAFEPGEAGEAAWCTEMGNLSGTAFTEFRSPRTSYEYDVYTWAVNEYYTRLSASVTRVNGAWPPRQWSKAIVVCRV